LFAVSLTSPFGDAFELFFCEHPAAPVAAFLGFVCELQTQQLSEWACYLSPLF
jgi:hypothetical protein